MYIIDYIQNLLVWLHWGHAYVWTNFVHRTYFTRAVKQDCLEVHSLLRDLWLFHRVALLHAVSTMKQSCLPPALILEEAGRGWRSPVQCQHFSFLWLWPGKGSEAAVRFGWEGALQRAGLQPPAEAPWASVGCPLPWGCPLPAEEEISPASTSEGPAAL